MPHNVIVSGLPEINNLNKLVFILKPVLQKVGITKFWIRKTEKLPNSRLHQALIELYTSDEAYSAVKVLDGYKFFLGNSFPLSAHFDDPTLGRCHGLRRPQERRDRKRHRPRSPFVPETSELDLEIELLKKKRLIIEEERRILMERKKLELVQAFGPTALRQFDDFKEPRDRYRSRRSPGSYRGRRPSPPTRMRSPMLRSRVRPPRHGPQQMSRPAPQPSRSKATPIVLSERNKDRETIPGLPQFVVPCKLILKEMTAMINVHARPEEVGHVRNLIRSAVRSRLAVIMDEQPLLSHQDIVKLYRVSHPLDKDEQFVINQLKNLRACHLPEITKSSKKNTKGDGDKAKVPVNTQQKGAGIPGNVKLIKTDKTEDGNDVKTTVKNYEDNEMKAEPNDGIRIEIKKDGITEVNANNLIKEPRKPKSEKLPSATASVIKQEPVNQFAVDDAWVTGGDDWTDWSTVMNSEALRDQAASTMLTE